MKPSFFKNKFRSKFKNPAAWAELGISILGAVSIHPLNAGEHVQRIQPVYRYVSENKEQDLAKSIENHLIQTSRKHSLKPDQGIAILRKAYLNRYRYFSYDVSGYEDFVSDFEEKHDLKTVFEEYTNIPSSVRRKIELIDFDLIDRVLKYRLLPQSFKRFHFGSICHGSQEILENVPPESLETKINYFNLGKLAAEKKIEVLIHTTNFETTTNLREIRAFEFFWNGTKFYRIKSTEPKKSRPEVPWKDVSAGKT